MLSAPISFQKKTKKNYHTACFTQHSNFSSRFSLIVERTKIEKNSLSLSRSSERIVLTKKAPRRSRFFSEKNFVSRERRTNERRERVCESQRESERESREEYERERRRERRDFAFFLIFISPILNFSKGGVLKGKTKKKK